MSKFEKWLQQFHVTSKTETKDSMMKAEVLIREDVYQIPYGQAFLKAVEISNKIFKSKSEKNYLENLTKLMDNLDGFTYTTSHEIAS